MKKAKFWKVGHFHKSNFTHYLVYGCELSTYPDTIACNNDTAAAINTGVSDVKKVDCPDCLKLIKGDRMKKKVHLMIDGVGGCCNSYLYNTAKTIEAFNDFIVAGDNLVCKHCLNSALYISNRPLEKDEFEEPKKYISTIEARPEEHERYIKYCLKTSIKVLSRVVEERGKCEIRDYYFLCKKDNENFMKGVANIDAQEPKTQLELDTEKYNLSKEPVEEPYEPVKVVLTGEDAIKYIKSKEPKYKPEDPYLKPSKELVLTNIQGDEFKLLTEYKEANYDDIYSINYDLAKAEIKIEYRDEVVVEAKLFKFIKDNLVDKLPNYKPEDVAFKPLNHSEHYEKQEGLESIEKMELIACHGIPKMYHQKIKSNLNLALAVKYHDRLGKKDETEKEIDKMKNYMNRSVKGEWRG